MKCPVCNQVDLVMADRQGVEIDYCPQCRGVWLDRGELDKIIERSSQIQDGSLGGRERGHDHDDYRSHGQDWKHRRKSWLGELFD
jgi:uncharacterized protein